MMINSYDYIIVGSGFGGSISAMRLAEKGYSVLVIEKGKRYNTKDFPKTNWNLRKYIWMPFFGLHGIQKLTLFRHAFILSGVGVGGGSLVYANTLMMPPEKFFENSQWALFNNWKSELKPFYDKVDFMLGRTKLKNFHEEDRILREIAKDIGKENSFDHVYVAVNFNADEDKDPYFKGQGPIRNPCTECGGCMIGCRENAKNTLDKNYLYFAEKYGAKVLSETEVVKISFENEQYIIETINSTGLLRNKKQKFISKGLIVAGGVLGTIKLLLKQRDIYKTMPDISPKLGEKLRTNSESLCAATSANVKLNNGVAISSIFKPDEDTYVEIVKYPTGSNVMKNLLTLAVNGTKHFWLRGFKWVFKVLLNPIKFFRTIINFKWADNTVIFLVMQSVDNSMQMLLRKSIFGYRLKIKNSGKNKVPAYIKSGQDVMNRYAKKTGAVPTNAITEILFNIPSTAHILGGCPMGDSSINGVVNKNFSVFNYPNMYILDGSVVQGNLGVNPSFTISAISEYAMSKIPPKNSKTHKSFEEQLVK